MSVLAISMGSDSSNLQFNTEDHWKKFHTYLILVPYISNIVSPSLSTCPRTCDRKCLCVPMHSSGTTLFAMKPHETAYWALEIFFDTITILAKQMIV